MKQPEALRLAKELVSVHQGHADEGPSTFSEAAAELRRLHEANQELIDAAQEVLASFDKEGSDGWMDGDLHSSDFNRLKKAVARAAIAKGEKA